MSILLLLAGTSGWADDITSNNLSLVGALKMAVVDHPTILQRLGEYEAAQSERMVAEYQRYPTISLSGSESNVDLTQSNATLQQPIWSGGRITAGIQAAEAGVVVSQHGVTQAQSLILTETAQRFFDLQRATRSYDIAVDNVQAHERLYEMIQRRVVAATSPEVDELLANARLQSAKNEMLIFDNEVRATRATLAQLIGSPIVSVASEPPPAPLMMSRSTIVAASLDFSPSVAGLTAEVDRLDAQVEQAKASTRPQIALAYDRRLGDLLPGQQAEQVFLQIEYEPGAGFSAQSSIAAARARQRSGKQAVAAEERAITSQVDVLWSQLQSSYQQKLPAERLVSATEEVVESYLRQYTVGRKSWLDVLNAQREATQAKYNLVGVQTAMSSTHYRLMILMGRISARSLGIQ